MKQPIQSQAVEQWINSIEGELMVLRNKLILKIERNLLEERKPILIKGLNDFATLLGNTNLNELIYNSKDNKDESNI